MEGMFSGVSSASVGVKRCWLHERGQCHRGNNCRYLHDVETTDAERRVESLTSDLQNDTASVRPCRYFLRTGRCAFGSKCRFSHCQKLLPPVAEVSDAGREDHPEVQKSAACSDQHVPHARCDRRQPCWFFKRGRCQFGERCRYRHISVSDTSVKVTEQSRPADETCQPHGGETVEPKRTSTIESETHQSNGESKQTSTIETNETSQSSETVEPRHTSTTKETGHSSEKVESRCTSAAEKEAQSVNEVATAADPSHATSQTLSEVRSSAQKVKLDTLRSTEITQLRRRYPRAAVTESEDGSTAAKFIFEPSDPDWVMT